MHSAAPFSQTRLPALAALSRLETCLHATHDPIRRNSSPTNNLLRIQVYHILSLITPTFMHGASVFIIFSANYARDGRDKVGTPGHVALQ